MNKPTLNEPAINLLHWISNVTISDVVILLHLGIYLVSWINQMLYLHCDNWVRSDNITKLSLLFKNWNQVNRKQECISVGCIPTAVVAATRCQYRRSGLTPLEAEPSGGRPPGGRSPLGAPSAAEGRPPESDTPEADPPGSRPHWEQIPFEAEPPGGRPPEQTVASENITFPCVCKNCNTIQIISLKYNNKNGNYDKRLLRSNITVMLSMFIHKKGIREQYSTESCTSYRIVTIASTFRQDQCQTYRLELKQNILLVKIWRDKLVFGEVFVALFWWHLEWLWSISLMIHTYQR